MDMNGELHVPYTSSLGKNPHTDEMGG